MRQLWVALLSAGALLYGVPGQAQDSQAFRWLERIYSASQNLSYSGTFLYQYGDHIETSRIVRLVDQTGVHERVETLDGTPREIVRSNDEVACYLPESRTIKIDNRPGTRPFPHVRGDRLADIAEYYDVRVGGIERIAGHEAQSIILEPRDALRYGHRLWADLNTGLLLKAKTFNDQHQQVEQFTFTQLQIGGPIDRAQVESRFAAQGKDWRIENSAMTETNLSEQGWVLKTLPHGYRKVTELKRRVGDSHDVGHMVVSDGLAAVSVFIEPLRSSGSQVPIGYTRHGAFNIYTRNVDGYLVTVIGEVPAGSVRQIADAVEHRR